MRKYLLILFSLSIVGVILSADLQNYYKKGEIKLDGLRSFGIKTDWEDFFYHPYCQLFTSDNGSIFVVCNRKHCIFKFDNKGNFVKKFGQKGLGPGDLYSPGNLTMLDGKYLVVSNIGTSRKITIWDLDGNYINVIKTGQNHFNTTALRKSKLAYLTFSQFAQKNNEYFDKYLLIIKDIESGSEKIIQEITLLDRSTIELGPGMSTNVGNFFGEVFTTQTINGNLAVGISNQPEIKIYSTDGRIIASFKLKIKSIPVTNNYVQRFKEHIIAGIKKKIKETTDETRKWWYKQSLKIFPKYDFSKIFTDYLPLYKEVLVDSDGNFLVFTYNDCIDECKTYFQVYSQKGEFICETELNTGNYDLSINTRFKNIRFTANGIIGYAMEKGDEEEIYRLFKSNY